MATLNQSSTVWVSSRQGTDLNPACPWPASCRIRRHEQACLRVHGSFCCAASEGRRDRLPGRKVARILSPDSGTVVYESPCLYAHNVQNNDSINHVITTCHQPSQRCSPANGGGGVSVVAVVPALLLIMIMLVIIASSPWSSSAHSECPCSQLISQKSFPRNSVKSSGPKLRGRLLRPGELFSAQEVQPKVKD